MSKPWEAPAKGGRLSGDDVVRLSEQIAGITAAGLPLAPGLRATAEEMPGGRLRSALQEMARTIDTGASVAEAVEAQGGRLPGHLRGLVLAGTRTGKMSQVLGRFVAFVSVGTDLRRRLWVSLAYPAAALVLSVGVFLFVCTSLVTTFAVTFKDFGIPLPRLTVVLLAVAQSISVGYQSVAEGAVGLLVFVLLFSFLVDARTRRSLVGSLPVVGGVWQNTSLAEFCHLLGLLLECDVPIVEAVELTGEGMTDAKIERACRTMRRDVEGGLSLSDAISGCPVFPRGLARVLRWAEGHQSMPESLHMIGEMFEARARAQAGIAGTMLSVLAFMTILSGVSALVIGLLLPMITLIQALAG